MILFVLLGTLALLAVATALGTLVIERMYPPQGRLVDVAGGRLHVVELGPPDAAGPPLVLLHGASSNLGAMRFPLGERLAQRHRVLLIDRPGHGFSRRDRLDDGTPAAQAAMIADGLRRLGVEQALVVAHSWAGSVGNALALDHPNQVAGLALLAPVTHPWQGGVAWYHELAVRPVIGPLFARTLALPLGLLLMKPGTAAAFLPQAAPVDYVESTAVPLLLRPLQFLANAADMVALKPAVTAMAPRYGTIRAPVAVLSGDADVTVPPTVHARQFVAAVPAATLTLLPGVGHMVQNADPARVEATIEALLAELAARRELVHP
jgi:pimeloyl-ACP methyl ester carboxylesterase